MTTPTYTLLPLAAITPSLTNPRKHFSLPGLEELAASILTSGVHQPVLVRPIPPARLQDTFEQRLPGQPLPTWELITGERRLRASQLAKMADIPAICTDMTDAEALEVQIIENLQREDVPPLDEAEGYEHLLQATGQRAEELAARIGKSRSYVYARLKLLALGHEGRTALREGAIDFSRALLLARIPDTALQAKATAELVQHDYSARDASAHIQQHYMLRLENACFPTSDATLLPAAGPCSTCPKRTGADRDLFADVSATDLCTDPPCHQAKLAAHVQRQHAAVLAQGATIIDGDDARLLMPRPDPKAIPGYRRLDDARDTPKGQPPLRFLLGDAAIAKAGTPTYIADPHNPGTLIAVLPTQAADHLLRKAGHLPDPPKGAGTTGTGPTHAQATAADRQAQAAAQAMAEHETRWRLSTLQQTWLAIQRERERSKTGYILPEVAMRQLALMILEFYIAPAEEALIAQIANLGNVATSAGIRNWIQDEADPDEALALLLLVEHATLSYLDAQNDANAEFLSKIAREHGVNAEEIRAQSLDQAKTEAQAQAQTPPTPPTPAAPAGGDADGAKPKTKNTPAKPPKAAPKPKPKTTAQEAAQGIAAAMQGLDEGDASCGASPATDQPTGATPQPAPAAGPGSTQLGVGSVVKINSTVTPKAKATKWSGRQGNIVNKAGPEAWLVSIWSKTKGDHTINEQVFHTTELDLVPHPQKREGGAG